VIGSAARRPGRVRLPPLGAAARARLWWSYQRYALAIVAATAAVVAAAVLLAPPWIWIPAALIAIAPLSFAGRVLAMWPRKLRATRIALARIATGRFAPAQVRGHCGDPCFRVVADEILRRAGTPRRQRQILIARYEEELARRDVLLLVDRTAGVVVTVGADGQFRQEALGSGGTEERI
jgi:hypothetical protein